MVLWKPNYSLNAWMGVSDMQADLFKLSVCFYFTSIVKQGNQMTPRTILAGGSHSLLSLYKRLTSLSV